ncbi:peptidase M14 [Litoribacter alkaliphilus]|uniref:Peptidase M14 n=1 Tax=Litoribacter ruber TaxID=702568 RepID=A0AAP2CKK0_9BACT|nr:M14 metallopeptidase family protein [Litoribacter alkaliphilus]MBS9525489.1 peptidase M14 [Litoribacter alkaliphilus]
MKKQLTALILLILFFSQGHAQDSKLDHRKLKEASDKYKESSITHRRFKHIDIMPLVIKRRANKDFQVEELGKSVEGREIYQLAYGNGQKRVMLWSQMHGNESTATMSLMDIFNFLEGKNDGFDAIRKAIEDNLDLRFIPMVNPDGAEAFKRRNAYDIDLNRDAIHLTSPEARILKGARDNFEPEYGFNLHDQQIYYNAVNTAKPATISVLAPAFNFEKDINEVRERALKVIVGMNEVLQEIIPGQVGKYDDGFEPRAFGDNFQKWGTSTILIESGGYPGDPDKQYIRELNFIIILNALYEIATQQYGQYAVEDYFEIPDNDTKLVDLMLRNVTIKRDDLEYKVDLGIRRREVEADSAYYTESSILDLGDLSVYYGYEELDAEGYVMTEGKVWAPAMDMKLSQKEAIEMLKKGFLGVTYDFYPDKTHDLPINILLENDEYKSGHTVGSTANFFLEKNGEKHYAIVNGYLVDLRNPEVEGVRMRVY